MDKFTEYRRKKDYLICVDSDGCAMDTMDIKHIRCFGPCLIREWGLEPWQDELLRRWNEINLYSMTRGINRFKGLAALLKEVDASYCRIEDLDTLLEWTETASELSNDALAHLKDLSDSKALQKALSWSKEVNRQIDLLPEEQITPFDYVKKALSLADLAADIAIVSSANPEAVVSEWERHGLMEYADVVLTQEMGSKAFCISEMLKKGYEPDHVLMIGDAPGDLQAAEKNNVLFYPILVKKERDSWVCFCEQAFSKFLKGSYDGNYQNEMKAAFVSNLSHREVQE